MRHNLAARAGRWSAQHRKQAILGWLAFVIIATIAGGAVGQQQLDREDSGNGQSRVADEAIADAGFPKQTDEQVLVQGMRGATATDPRTQNAACARRRTSPRSSRRCRPATRAWSPRTAARSS